MWLLNLGETCKSYFFLYYFYYRYFPILIWQAFIGRKYFDENGSPWCWRHLTWSNWRNGGRACFVHFIRFPKLSDILRETFRRLWEPPAAADTAEALMREQSEATMRGITAHRKRWLTGGSAHAWAAVAFLWALCAFERFPCRAWGSAVLHTSPQGAI